MQERAATLEERLKQSDAVILQLLGSAAAGAALGLDAALPPAAAVYVAESHRGSRDAKDGGEYAATARAGDACHVPHAALHSPKTPRSSA